VLDANGDRWICAWKENFEYLSITHLRSSMSLHPDPREGGGRRAFADKEEREGELKETRGGRVGVE
jgi:hypothetical protein